jgi:hypothetical protein
MKGGRKKKAAVAMASPFIVNTFSTPNISLDNYLTLDDITMMEFFKACAVSDDPVLADLGRGLVQRKLYKCIDITTDREEKKLNFVTAVSDWLSKQGKKRKDEFILDVPGRIAYLRYVPDKKKSAKVIFIERSGGDLVEITDYEPTGPLVALTRETNQIRYYFKQEIRDEIDKLAQKHGLRRTHETEQCEAGNLR